MSFLRAAVPRGPVVEKALEGVTLEQLRAAWELIDADLLFAGGDNAMPCLLVNDVFVPGADCQEVHWEELPMLAALFRKHGVREILSWVADVRRIKPRDWRGRPL